MAGSKEASIYWQDKGVKPTHVTCNQWGDTGKGKLTDEGAQYADIVIKTNGGANAGHTVNNEYGEFKLHLMPGGFANPEALSVIGTHVAVDPLQLSQEYDEINSRVPHTPNLLISNKAAVVMPWHIALDGIGGDGIGTTKRGIGFTYADRALRRGFLMGDLNKENFYERFADEYDYQLHNIEFQATEVINNIHQRLKKVQHEGQEERLEAKLDALAESQKKGWLPTSEEILFQYKDVSEKLRPMIGNTAPRIRQAYVNKKVVLGEAGQGALLDLDYGGYPFVTSSHPGVAGFMISTGLGAHEIGRVIGSTKAYMTRVGEGPMPTELEDDMGEYLREHGKEYGATTGRPRRTGWLDAMATKYGAQTSGVTEIALTKLDILDELPYINIAVGYEIDGKQYSQLEDMDPEIMEKAKPIYEIVDGWSQEITGVRSYEDLPENAKNYVSKVEKLVGLPVSVISVGPKREQTIYRAAA